MARGPAARRDVVTFLHVTVVGTPVGQGRLSYVGRGRVVHSNAKTLKPWREKIAAHVRAQMTGEDWPIDGPVKVEIVFYLARPKSAPHRMWPHKRPDIDHLARLRA
jgi:Holliday junction resolvase RusA-like endonuclease